MILHHDVYFHSQCDSQIHITTVARPQFAGSGEPATRAITLYYWLHNDIAIYRFTIIHFITFLFLFLAQQHVFSLLAKTRQMNEPNRPAKQTRQNVLPWKHARSTREYDPPNLLARDPPFPAQDPPGRTWLASLLPPPPHGSANGAGGRGQGAGPARSSTLNRYFYFLMNDYIFL